MDTYKSSSTESQDRARHVVHAGRARRQSPPARRLTKRALPSGGARSRLIDPRDFHPRTPAVAELALSKGATLSMLNLDEEERDLLIAAGIIGSDTERIEAAERVSERLKHKPGNLSEEDRVAAVFVAVAMTRQSLEVMPRLRGRPKKVGDYLPWRPWDWDWGLSLRLVLPWAFRKALTDLAQSDTLATDWEPLEREEGNVFLDKTELEPDGAIYRRSRSSSKDKPHGGSFAKPPDALRGSRLPSTEEELLLTKRERWIIRAQARSCTAYPACPEFGCGEPLASYHPYDPVGAPPSVRRSAPKQMPKALRTYTEQRDRQLYTVNVFEGYVPKRREEDEQMTRAQYEALRDQIEDVREDLRQEISHAVRLPDDDVGVHEAVERFIENALSD